MDPVSVTYSVPLETVRTYTGRRRLSLAIDEKLHVRHENSSVPHALAIHGLGGTGKTQLALKYVEGHKDRYNPILWINAQDEETVRSSFERCATELQLSVDRTQVQRPALTDAAAVRAVLTWLRGRKESEDEWLIVIDNADDVTWGVKKVIPKGIRGSVIIISQDEQSPKLIDGECEALRIEMMEPLEARSLLLQHLRWGADSAPQDIRDNCDTVAERLGYLALAVNLAGAYIGNDSNQEAALKQYLADYNKHQDELLQSEDYRGLSAINKTMWTVWDTTLKKIESRHADSRPGLLLAFLARFKGMIIHDEVFRLASLNISELCQELGQVTAKFPDWLIESMKTSEQEWDSFYYRKNRDVLIRYSLLQPVDGEWPGITMHELVQWRAMKYEQDQPWDRWYLIFIMAACLQRLREETRPNFRRQMLAYIPYVNRHDFDDAEFDDEKKTLIWRTAGWVFFSERLQKKAEESETQVMKTFKRILKKEHSDTVTSIINLVKTYQNQTRWEKAEELGMQVMETRKRVLGEKHSDTLISMNNLALTYSNQERWKEAEELQMQVMKTFNRMLGEEHSDTLTSMLNLTQTYQNQKRWKEAEELGLQVMETRKRLLGEKHPDTLISIDNLALTYHMQRRWKETEELRLQVTETFKKVLGEEHPDTLTSIYNLAATYQDQERWEEAEKLGTQVMKTFKRVLGEEHSTTLTSMYNLALLYNNQERWKEAEELEMQMMKTYKRILGEEHPDTLNSMTDLALTYSNQERWKEAEELEMQVLKTKKRVLGDEHSDTLESMNNLALTYGGQKRWKETEELQMQVMKARKRVSGEEHPLTLTSMTNLAVTYVAQERWKETEELQIQAMKTLTTVLEENHPFTLTSMNNLAWTWKSQGRHAEAVELMAKCVQLRGQRLGQRHPDTVSSLKAKREWEKEKHMIFSD